MHNSGVKSKYAFAYALNKIELNGSIAVLLRMVPLHVPDTFLNIIVPVLAQDKTSQL
jgi:hypothetical protein